MLCSLWICQFELSFSKFIFQNIIYLGSLSLFFMDVWVTDTSTFPGVGNSLMTWSIIHPLILYCLVALAVYLVDLVKCPETQYKFISLLIAQITVQYPLVYPHQLSILVSIYRHSNCQRSVQFSTSRLLHSNTQFYQIFTAF